ncbi:cytoplasmic phosphatidylinositol transfer protein 1 isoform X1 [Ictidomys tridecemlineatus]
MLLKEYRICMPLTVDEVGAAPGLARSRLPAPGCRSPAAASRPEVHCGCQGNPGGTLPPKPEGWRRRRQRICHFHLSPQRGRAALGGAVDSRWALWRHPETRLLGITMRQKELVRPLPPIKKTSKANPRAQARSIAGVSGAPFPGCGPCHSCSPPAVRSACGVPSGSRGPQPREGASRGPGGPSRRLVVAAGLDATPATPAHQASGTWLVLLQTTWLGNFLRLLFLPPRGAWSAGEPGAAGAAAPPQEGARARGARPGSRLRVLQLPGGGSVSKRYSASILRIPPKQRAPSSRKW